MDGALPSCRYFFEEYPFRMDAFEKKIYTVRKQRGHVSILIRMANHFLCLMDLLECNARKA